MPTDMSVTEDLPAAPSAVYARITDAAFLKARLEDGGGIDPQVVSITGADGSDDTSAGATVVTRQSIPASVLPSMVASMISGDPVTERTETWRADGDGYVAEFALVIKGAPASLKGTMTLSPTDGGSTMTIEGTANVPIPMFGPKLEGVITEQVSDLLRTECEYTRQHLGG